MGKLDFVLKDGTRVEWRAITFWSDLEEAVTNTKFIWSGGSFE
jgi:hypothetical protein